MKKNFGTKSLLYPIKKRMFILSGLLIAMLSGCTSLHPSEYVGGWGGRAEHSSEGLTFLLDADGSGFVGTYIGWVPLKWRATGDNRLEVVVTGFGDGVMIYEMDYLSSSHEMQLLRERMIGFYDGKVSDKSTHENMKLRRSKEFLAYMGQAKEHFNKCLAMYKRTHSDNKRTKHDVEHIEQTLKSWTDDLSVVEKINEGWSLNIAQDGAAGKPWISIRPAKEKDNVSMIVYANSYVIGNPEDISEFDEADKAWTPIQSVPAFAKRMPSRWDEKDEARTVELMREKKWTVAERVVMQGQRFFGRYQRTYEVDVNGTPLKEAILSLGECFGESLKPPLKATWWRILSQ